MSSEPLYTGKVKLVHQLEDGRVKITFTDKVTAGDGAKKDTIPGKGKINLDMTEFLFNRIEQAGVPTHMLSRESDTTLIARELRIFPIEVVVRNVVAGSFARRYGLEEGSSLDKPLVEYFVKDDDLHDPPIDANTILTLFDINPEQLSLMKARALQVNSALFEYFKKADMVLVDFKLEFGEDRDGDIYLADELSPDSMRVWDVETGEKLDKDRFRKALGDLLTGYRMIFERLSNTALEVQPAPLRAIIEILPKKRVTNPSGEVTKRAMVNSGVPNLGKVTVGKYIVAEFSHPQGTKWVHDLHRTASELLTNPLIEQYQITYDILLGNG